MCIMFWMHAYLLLGEVGGGWALEFSSFCHMALAYWLDAISKGPKKSRIPGPNPLPLPLVMDMH